ncbi:MAG: PDZ domain-containing protein [Gammaproteobacteria bacterium]|nr:MAG: PDZ domain-containing protein [Gammaproteobacteria bacterium]
MRYYCRMTVASFSLNSRTLVAALLLSTLLAGCVAIRPRPVVEQGVAPPRAVAEPGKYLVSAGHGAESVAELRAAPPPDNAEIVPGTAVRPDERKLVAKSYVRIGTGCYPASDEEAHEWAARIGRRVGADKVLLYGIADAKNPEQFAAAANAECDGAGPPEWAFIATFYVRYRLPFGAQFRNMSAAELKTAGVDGGVQLGSVIGGTPAAEANLRSGDFVIKFNGTPLRDRAAFQDMLRANMGKRVTLTVARNGEQFDRLVHLGVLATELHPER